MVFCVIFQSCLTQDQQLIIQRHEHIVRPSSVFSVRTVTMLMKTNSPEWWSRGPSCYLTSLWDLNSAPVLTVRQQIHEYTCL